MTYPSPRPHLSIEARTACARFLGLIACAPSPDQLVRFASEVESRAPNLAAAALREAAVPRDERRPDAAELLQRADETGRAAGFRATLRSDVGPVLLEGLLLEHDRYVAHITRRVFAGALPGEALTAAMEDTETGHHEALHEARLAIRSFLTGPGPVSEDWTEPARFVYREGTRGVSFLPPKVEIRVGTEVVFSRTWKEAMSYGPSPVPALLAMISPYLDVTEAVSGSSAGAHTTIRGSHAILETRPGSLPNDYHAALGVLGTERREQEEAALWRLRDRGFNC